MFFTDIMGGLGNQLFQIFTALSYEIETGNKAVFPYSALLGEPNTGITVRNTYWDTIFKNIKDKTTFRSLNPQKSNEEKKKWICYREQGFHYTPIPTDVRFDFQIFGYFQSWKYFHNHASKIARDLNLNSLQDEVLEKYPNMRFSADYTRVSMHFRLGDYKYKQDYHPVMPVEYYYSALNKCLTELYVRGIPRHKVAVLYFCEDEDEPFVVKERIEPLKLSFPTVNFFRVSAVNMADWEQLLIMANCHHHIIANSSFSWWGSYLADLLHPQYNRSKNEDYSLVYYPSKWFGPAMSVSTEDLCPSYWKRVSVEG